MMPSWTQKEKSARELAVFGGSPVRTRPWPKWPLATPGAQRNVLEVLHSEKWAISGYARVRDTFERRLSRAFAAYIGNRYCVACSSGSAALTIALQALGVGPGDDVVLTGLTWVACPSAVRRLGARPVLVDVENDGLCPSAKEIGRAITPRTRAILMVHMYSAICDVDGYRDVAKRNGIPLIEDASQAHGASWRGRKIGSFGDIGVFSTQQSKLLTSGEGGLCVCDDADLYDQLQQARADGRRYRVSPHSSYSVSSDSDEGDKISPDGYELEAVGSVAGQNLCLSEFQSALLLEGLERLDNENAHRITCVRVLSRMLDHEHGVVLMHPRPEVDQPTFYRLAIWLDPAIFNGLTATEIVPALASELATDIRCIDEPLSDNPLYVPTLGPWSREDRGMKKPSLPNAWRMHAEVVTFPHQLFLSDPGDMEDIVRALVKIRRSSERFSAPGIGNFRFMKRSNE